MALRSSGTDAQFLRNMQISFIIQLQKRGVNIKKGNISIRLKEIMADRNLRQSDILELCKPYCQKYEVKLGRNDLSQYVSGKVEPGQKNSPSLAWL